MLTRNGFTLIELLVVVTIIVVLLALLTPALDKAIYQAELAQCAAQLHAIGMATMTYAVSNGRAFPYRSPIQSGWGNGTPTVVKQGTVHDLRPMMRDYISTQVWIDPLCPKMDFNLSDDDSNILGSYALWFGYGHLNNDSGFMTRIGQRVRWAGRDYPVLVSDYDYVVVESGNPGVFGNHPDTDDVMHPQGWLNAEPFLAASAALGNKWTQSRYENWGRYDRGLIDMNFGFDDNSVQRYNAVTRGDKVSNEDPRMDKLPRGSAYTDIERAWITVPAN